MLNSLKKAVRKIGDEFIYGGHLVALGPTIISYIYIRLSGLRVAWQILLVIYLIVYIIHLMDRYIDIDKDSSPDRLNHYKSYKGSIPLILLLATIGLIVPIVKSGFAIILIAIFLILIGLSYSLLFKKITRYILGFKSFYVALSFPSIIFFTAYYYHISISIGALLLYSFFFLRWLCNTIFCDLKDMEQDKKDGLKTFAVRFSKQHFYIFLYLINLLSLAPIVLGVQFGYLPYYSLLLMISFIYYSYYLVLSLRANTDYQKLANIWADGESLIWLLTITIGGKLWS